MRAAEWRAPSWLGAHSEHHNRDEVSSGEVGRYDGKMTVPFLTLARKSPLSLDTDVLGLGDVKGVLGRRGS